MATDDATRSEKLPGWATQRTEPRRSDPSPDSMQREKDYGDAADAPAAAHDHGDDRPSSALGSDEEAANPAAPPPGHELPPSTSSTLPFTSLAYEIVFVAVVCCAQLFTQASLGASIPILGYMSATFGGLDPGQQSWIAAAFSLTVGTFILIAGRIGDMVGHKKLFVAGWSWHALWSLIGGLSALSHQQIFFDVCRAMQGISCAMLLPSSLAIFGSTYAPGRRKELVFALFGATAPNGFLVGAVFAGIFAELAWWPWAYWAMAIASSLLAVISVFVIPRLDDGHRPTESQSFDYAGAITGVAGLVLFNVAWNQAPIVGWDTPYVIVLLILGLMAMVAFVFIERSVEQPLLPVSALTSEVNFVLGCIALGWGSFSIWLYYVWRFEIVLRDNSPLLTVAQLSPASLAGIVAALLTAYLLSRVRPEIIMAISLCCFFAANVILATMPVIQIYWAQTFVGQLVAPFGMDMSFPAATVIVSNCVPRQHQGIAASLVVTAVNYSISIGFGIGSTVESYIQRAGGSIVEATRGATYAGVGLAASGVLLSVVFIIHAGVKRRRSRRREPQTAVESSVE